MLATPAIAPINSHSGTACCLQEVAGQGCPCILHSCRRTTTSWSCIRHSRGLGGMLISLPLKPKPASDGQNSCGPAAQSLGTAGHRVLRVSYERSVPAAAASRPAQTSVGVPGWRLMGVAPCSSCNVGVPRARALEARCGLIGCSQMFRQRQQTCRDALCDSGRCFRHVRHFGRWKPGGCVPGH